MQAKRDGDRFVCFKLEGDRVLQKGGGITGL